MANNELMILMACRYAVQSKIDDGSGNFALRNEEGDWTMVPYRDVINYLDEQIKKVEG